MGSGPGLPWAVRRPGRALAGAGLALAAALALLSRFELDPNVEHLLPPDDPTVGLTRRLQADRPPSRSLALILRAPLASDLEEAVPRALRALRSIPDVAGVVATREEFAGPRAAWYAQAPLPFLPAESLDRLRDRLAGPGRRAELESARLRIAEDPLAGKAVVRDDPLGVRWIFGEAMERAPSRFPARLRPGTPWLIFEEPAVAILLVSGRSDSFDVSFSRAFLARLRGALRAAFEGSPVRHELAGGYVSAEWQESAMRRDMQVQTIGSALLVVAFLAWFTRSLAGAHLILVPAGLGIVCALALGGALLGPLTPLVASAAAVLVAQGIDFPVHLFSRFRSERAALGRDEAIGSALGSLGRPLLGACGTTVAAFAALLTSSFPGFRQFGLILTLGLAFCLLATLWVFPALLRWADRGARRGAPGPPWIVRCAARAGPSRAAAALVLVLGLAGWVAAIRGGVRMDLDLRRSMAPGDPGLATLEGLERDLGASFSPVYVLVDGGTPLEELRAGAERLRREGFAAATDGPHALVPPPGAAERAGVFRREIRGWEEGALRDLEDLGFRGEALRPALARLSGLLARDLPGLEPLDRPEFGALRSSMVVVEDGRRSWVVTALPPRSLWLPEERRRFDRAAREAWGAGARLFSAFHLPDHASRTLGEDLLRVMALTAAAVVLLTMVALGSVTDGLRALVPVMVAFGATLGLAALLGGSINPMNLVAFPLIVGIGVDAGIHYMARLREDPARDARRALLGAGPGIWGSTATTLLAFGSIATSSTPGLVSMGLLVAGGAAASFLAAFLLLPAIAGERVEQGAPAGVQ